MYGTAVSADTNAMRRIAGDMDEDALACRSISSELHIISQRLELQQAVPYPGQSHDGSFCRVLDDISESISDVSTHWQEIAGILCTSADRMERREHELEEEVNRLSVI